ncbi:hypothetical protein OAI07_01385 [Akkermansiaceae bacterium]|nr:hypothetical protein [Akkermansiaceae bacterium]
MLKKLKSRKLWVAIGSAIIVTLATQLGLPEEVAVKYVNIAIAYIIGQGAVDVSANFKKS